MSLLTTPLPKNETWRPQEPPSLSGQRELVLDCETTGLRWWARDRPIGISVTTFDGKSQYLPFGHAAGNLDEDTVKRWARQELRDKRLFFFNAPFDINMLYAWGVDLEEQGCTVSDVGHYVALLDDHRVSSSLESVAQDYLGIGKLKGLAIKYLATYHASDVAEYACRDTWLVYKLVYKLLPELEKQDLQRVRQLEDDCLFVTCEMMRNGAPIDEEKLDLWLKQSERESLHCVLELNKLAGIKVNPTSRNDLFRLFQHLRLDLPKDATGNVSFVKETLKGIEHPVIRTLHRARRLASLRSKYLVRYHEEIKRNGKLRYSLHQLRVDEGGTISGRYSSSGFGTDEHDGVNIQQVAGKKQKLSVKGDEDLEGYVIRELFIPESGGWLSSDADQIEYRLFAHYARPPAVLAAYRANPRVDYHVIVMEMLTKIRPITRELTKDVNFAKIYGARTKKLAFMMGLPVDQAQLFVNAYDHLFPEAEQLLSRASFRAKQRGFVKTLMGRRARFFDDRFLHAALNRVIQGTAADVMKLKLAELHRERKNTGFKLRFCVHDEVDGDIQDGEGAKKVRAILNSQSLPTEVPLLWTVSVGPNWEASKPMEEK